jgi:hypothetical protein
MKSLKLFLSTLIIALLAGCSLKTPDKGQTVNAVIGDESFTSLYGDRLLADVSEDERLQIHLRYVEEFLRSRDVSDLSEELRKNREEMLDLLNAYWQAGEFPKNYDYPDQRRPCFIDKDGNICAVGYLIEQTAGRVVAEDINEKYKYEYLLAMNDEGVDNWIDNSGLTKEECAMIQPTYGPSPEVNYNYVSPEYGISSALIGGASLSFGVINGIQISNGSDNRTAAILGMVVGAGQITLGAVNHPEETVFVNGSTAINESQRKLSLVNIGLGTSTLLLSTWNLIANREPKDKSVSWNIYSWPTEESTAGIGFSLRKRF